MARSGLLITHHSLLITLWAGALAPAQIFINELEYDQAGPDTAEFVELFEPARTGRSLAGWELILYNGTSTSRSPYLTIPLASAPGGVMPADGYLVLGTSPNVPNVDIHIPAGATGWIQNGSPDGMALVHDGAVIELLSYEGEFIGATDGTGGPAAGMLFHDIGVEDDAGFAVTLQRLQDLTAWAATPDAAATPGRRNASEPYLLASAGLTLMHRGDADSGPIPLCASGGTPPYTFVITSLPSNGQLAHDAGLITTTPTQLAGSLRYLPSPGFSGLDAFEFSVRDSLAVVSNPVVHEIAVQAGGVVISEVMHRPTGDQRVYEFVELYNYGPAPVALGRIDGGITDSADTSVNLLGAVLPPGAARIIAPDAGLLGISEETFRCEWDLREEDILRVPSANLEALFAVPDPSCALSEGSRVMLFDSAGDLLDAVDLGRPGMAPAAAGESLTIDDALLASGGPLDTRQNDSPGPWRSAGSPGVPGVRFSQRGDRGGPMIVPSWSGSFVSVSCIGRCCLPAGGCAELTYSDCVSNEGDVFGWVPDTSCGTQASELEPFVECLGGPGQNYGTGCGPWDDDLDGDVDVFDFGGFQSAFGEPTCP